MIQKKQEIRMENKDIELNNKRLKNQVNEKVNKMNKIFDKLRNEELGNMKNQNTKEEIEMIKELTKFADMWISVSLLNPRTKKRVETLNCHMCTRKSCYKNSKNCRVRYPRFPIIETLVSLPARIKHTEDLTEKNCRS